ncbi:MAG TPA: GNAT family N-acetyltransferase [Chthoniobacterales bacterium]|jgi:putative acetyltransferase
MKCTLRPATNEDRAAVENLVFSVLAEYGLSPDPGGTDSDLHSIEDTYQKSGGCFAVLVSDAGEVVGSVGIFPMSSSTCELRKMYLARSARGRGFGRLLLEHALAQAAALGFTRVTLETASVLREAISLYVMAFGPSLRTIFPPAVMLPTSSKSLPLLQSRRAELKDSG